MNYTVVAYIRIVRCLLLLESENKFTFLHSYCHIVSASLFTILIIPALVKKKGHIITYSIAYMSFP